MRLIQNLCSRIGRVFRLIWRQSAISTGILLTALNKPARKETKRRLWPLLICLIALISTCLEMPIWAKLRTKKLLQRNT
ncbi:hypothetical protein GBFDFA_17870 (plasmid) [Edwardsiella anguillarum]|nr:hypothetical protein GBFDFA_17870 [Edwardsiella anguillarum]